jgi:hypothetical protein
VEELMAYHYCSLTYISFLFIDGTPSNSEDVDRGGICRIQEL